MRTRRFLAIFAAASILATTMLATLGAAGAAASRTDGGRRGSAARRGAAARTVRKPRQVTVASALGALLHAGAIDQATYESDLGIYTAARTSLKRLSGTRREELGAVLGNVEAMAARHLLSASRLPVAFATLARNREWWTSGPLLGSGQRVSVAGSRLVWEHYSGQGIEIQWLASFGKANGYYLSHETTALEELLDEAIALATQRAGGIAWEYMFAFDGGSPPWTSGLSQGTALQALARAWSRTHETRYLTAAQQALGIYRVPPREGVRVTTPAGAHYLEYTYAPGERIVNGFIQALVGLYEYAKLSGDSAGEQLFETGDAQARAELPSFDTGAWSRYDQHSESNLNYHELLAEFLEHLCERTSSGEPLSPTGPIAGDQVYCTTAQRFRAYMTTPPQVALVTTTVKAGERAGVQIRLSKISTVTLTISDGEKTVWTNKATVEGGTPRLLWVTPRKPGGYGVTLRAVDLAGNEEVATGAIAVKQAPKPRGKKGHPKRGASKAKAVRSVWISPRVQRLRVR